jgi:hypothetical protein
MPTLLPRWSVYSAGLPLDVKEPVENFDWMPEKEKRWYVDVKQALDAVPQSREWLKTEKIGRYQDAIFIKIFNCLKLKDLHSGGSIICLFRSYANCLKEWDFWVKATKTRFARESYDRTQIPFHEVFALICLVERMEGGGLPGFNFDQIRAEFISSMKEFNIPGTIDQAMADIRALWKEMDEPDQKIESHGC